MIIRFTLALLAALTLAAPTARADCAVGSLTAWPPATTALPLRPLILLDAYGEDRPPIAALAKDARAALVNGKQRIPLTVEAIHTGALELTQAALTPETPLAPDTRYTLELRTADGKVITPSHHTPDGRRPAAWTTTAETPATPALTAPPRVSQHTYALFGCGPAAHVDIAIATAAPGPLTAQVTLRDRATPDAPAPTYIVPINRGTLSIGHGMCSGAFNPTGPDRRLRAEFVVRDAAGQRSKPQTLDFAGVDPERHAH